MSDHEAVTTAGEATVRDQRDLAAEAASGDRAGWAEHLAHAWSTARTFAADHHHVARTHLTGKNRRGGALLALEHPRPAFEALALLAGDLGDGAFGREVAVEDDQMTILL